MILLKRISSGVSSHFNARLSEWLMVWPCIGMAGALHVQDDMFSTSPSFEGVSQWLSEGEWAFFLTICAILRLAALVVNGTFDRFQYSPHLRISASFVSGFFWFQFASGFAQSAILGNGAGSAVIAYSTFVLAEAANAFRASRDLGRMRKGRKWKTF